MVPIWQNKIKSTKALLQLIAFFVFEIVTNAQEEEAADPYSCKKKFFSNASSFVCVCDMKFCDNVQSINEIKPNTIVLYKTTPDEHRLKRTEILFQKFDKKNTEKKKILELTLFKNESADERRQEIFGFGGAFTDAVGINLVSLSPALHAQILDSYFGLSGIGYTIGRVPIASSDFSTYAYSYLDTYDDFEASSFTLTMEDLNYKIPSILFAKFVAGNLALIASPWSAPGWMKQNNNMKGGAALKGDLNGKYYRTYAKYLVKFFEEYEENNVTFWGMTLQNQPNTGKNPHFNYQTMNMDSDMQRQFAKDVLVPALRASSASKNLKIIAHDDNINLIADAAEHIYANNNTVIDGLGVHCHPKSLHNVLTKVHRQYPNKFIISTKPCINKRRRPILGDWDRAFDYAKDILYSLKNWAIGWIDWNIVLDMQGGPNWAGNVADAPIIINKEANEFYKQPMYYIIGHFSKFIPRGSIFYKIDASDDTIFLKAVSFLTPTGQRVVVLLNFYKHKSQTVWLRDTRTPDSFAMIKVKPKSIYTAIWN